MLVKPHNHISSNTSLILLCAMSMPVHFHLKQTGTKNSSDQSLNISLVSQSQPPPRSIAEEAGLYGSQLMKLSSATVEIQDSIK